MAEFNIRTDAVDVEQIMRQIRARIREKRGVDYTEQQIQELATVKLERFLDPKGVRSDLVEQFRRTRTATPEPPKYTFEDSTIYDTHRGLLRFMRRLLNPILKLLFNPNPLIHVIHTQAQINSLYAQQFRVRDELDALYYEVIHNLVLELTRLGIENKNLKMRLESLASRLDFDERRSRALEGVVQYRSGTAAAREERPRVMESAPLPVEGLSAAAAPSTPGTLGTADGTARRRRRRRRGRRGGAGHAPGAGASPGTPGTTPEAGGAAGAGTGGPAPDDAPGGGMPTAAATQGRSNGPMDNAASSVPLNIDVAERGPQRGSRVGDPDEGPDDTSDL